MKFTTRPFLKNKEPKTSTPLLITKKSRPSLNGLVPAKTTLWWASSVRQITSSPHYLKQDMSLRRLAQSCALCRSGSSWSLKKCSVCGMIVHEKCARLSFCIPPSRYQWKPGKRRMLADYCPRNSPKVARPVVFCMVTLSTNANYLLLAQDLARKTLKTFLKDICDGSLIPRSSREILVRAAKRQKPEEMKEEIRDIPEPQKHTLSFLMLHWSKADHMLAVTEEFGVLTVGSGKDWYLLFAALLELPVSFWGQQLIP